METKNNDLFVDVPYYLIRIFIFFLVGVIAEIVMMQKGILDGELIEAVILILFISFTILPGSLMVIMAKCRDDLTRFIVLEKMAAEENKNILFIAEHFERPFDTAFVMIDASKSKEDVQQRLDEAIEDFADGRLDNSNHRLYLFLEKLFKYKAWSVKSIIPVGTELVLVAALYLHRPDIESFLVTLKHGINGMF